MAYYEIPVSENGFNQIVNTFRGETPFAVFRHKDDTTKAFILIHGTEDGGVRLGNTNDGDPFVLNSQDFLEFLIDTYYKEKYNISEFLTISCHSGYQCSAEYKGIKMSSIHTSKDEIKIMPIETIDGEYYLAIEIK